MYMIGKLDLVRYQVHLTESHRYPGEQKDTRERKTANANISFLEIEPNEAEEVRSKLTPHGSKPDFSGRSMGKTTEPASAYIGSNCQGTIATSHLPRKFHSSNIYLEERRGRKSADRSSLRELR
ncbi:uncharacterized protein MEPE_00755 [Melanopsichium pennsylvanicum]|uniref:Uncharacterized protein n=2 Tax=Melanopsichium pennsylvanicum TaxID=63383 RepID=A0AAJ5C2Z5_9BASI|nr:uncharacterized protein BN887_06198 [Melanopsichium pennsylvanicum 4]SNX82050.1 uncharacterized protein MEPE_00755 [Melanopsichium pennsylvanicum]